MPGRSAAGGRLGLLLGTLLGWLAGTAGAPAQNPPQRQVDGMVGGTALLPAFIPPEKAVSKIEWDFQPEGTLALVIAEFTPGKMERPNPGDRFRQRLEKADDTTLRIKGLVKYDGGVYTAHVIFKSAEMQEQTFLLVVSGNREPLERWNLLIYLSIVVMPFLIWVLYCLVKLLLKKRMPNCTDHQLKQNTAQGRDSMTMT